MSHRRCCCGTECELVSISSTCNTLLGGACSPCAPLQVTFNVPDIVANRKRVNNHHNYGNEPFGNFRWAGGTRLVITLRPHNWAGCASVYFFESMSVTWGCVGHPELTFSATSTGRYLVIDLPQNCPGKCEISISAVYVETPPDHSCFICSQTGSDCGANVVFDDVLSYPDGDTSSSSTHHCTSPSPPGPGQQIICEVGGDDCVDLFPCETFEAKSRECYSLAKASLDPILPIDNFPSNNGCAYFTYQCADYGKSMVCDTGFHCDLGPENTNDFVNYSSSANITRSFSCRLFPNTLLIPSGTIEGYIEAEGYAVMGAGVGFATNNVPIGGCSEVGTMGGTYRFPSTGVAVLGTFDPIFDGAFCREVFNILSRYYPLTNDTPGMPGWGCQIV